MEPSTDSSAWSVKLQLSSTTRTDCPAWATPAQQKAWSEPGLLVWNDEQRQLLHLSPFDAFTLLEYLQADQSWHQEATVNIGRPTAQVLSVLVLEE